MWFFTGKDRSNEGKKANTRRDQPPTGTAPIPRLVWIPLAILASLAVTTWAVVKIGALLFWENPGYAIRTLDIHVEGPSITATHVKEYMGVAVGTNLFSSSLAAMRNEFLKKTPIAKSVTLQRKLPSTLVVHVVERLPLARLGRWGSLAVDREGYVFNLRAGSREYPVINGCAAENLKPGVRVDQAVMNAIEVVDLCMRSKVGEHIKLASIDVSPKDHLELFLGGGEKIRLAWPDMDQILPETRPRVEQKLWNLAAALRYSEEQGHRLVNIDFTFSDDYVPAQEY